MDITYGNEQIFRLMPKFDIDKAREKAWDKKTSVFGSGFKGLFKRPKPEEVQITYSEYRYEPFWHVACNVYYKYERKRSYNVQIIAPEVQCVTFDEKNYPVTTKPPRQFTIMGIEHCTEEDNTEMIFDAVRLQEQDWKKYLRFEKELVSDLSLIPIDGSIIVSPEMRASAVVRKVLALILRPIQADTIHEEKANVNTVDLYFRPVYAFEYTWETNGRTAVAEFDGLTGEITSGGVTFRQQVEKMMTRDLLFDVGAEAANVLLPGSGIAIRLAKEWKNSEKQDNITNEK